MRLFVRPHQIPVRLATGLFMLNSGLGKASVDEETATALHGMASGTYPFLKNMEPMTFAKLLSKSEIALGVALVLPVVPSVVAGAALTAFAGGLMGLYLKTPGLRQEGSLRPTQEGVAIAKDIWLVGIGASLLCEELGRCD
ncbi:hypothetical protein [Microtetraspora fusca]|uniref:DoxX family membrane protein n=1 Tax=Microtetraspora fusca TaxID=1997 RepID=A0ABW6V8K8_MICFU|nr:hypothetical protein [Microtetraspora fusca]